jgi:ferrochelatase
MTYGSPASLERGDVAEYLSRVRGGRPAGDELVDEFARRYRIIGGSPLIPITRRQAAALERRLGWPAEVGMRFSEPGIRQGLDALRRRGADRVAAIVLSPQFSSMLMGGYGAAIDAALAADDAQVMEVRLAGAWHDEPSFVEALADRIREALSTLPEPEAPVLLTAHSLPRRVAEQEPGYLDQLVGTARSVAAAAGLDDERWHFCWQSAGHEPGEWMTPDFADLMPRLARDGHRSVVVAPVQFLADHLEVLFDVDVGARAQAEAAGLHFARIASLNDDERLIDALAAVAERTLRSAKTAVS